MKAATHHSDDFGDPLAVQAQCAAIALQYALSFDIYPPLDAASWSALQVVESIDNFLYFSAEACDIEIESITENPLLCRELEKQVEDARVLYELEQPSESRLRHIRCRNSFFSIPIAV